MDSVQKKLFQGFIWLHILHHAKHSPIYGTWMISELAHHGHTLSPGTMYPILHTMEKEGLLQHQNENIDGKIRKYYQITPKGKQQLDLARSYLDELIKEIGEKHV